MFKMRMGPRRPGEWKWVSKRGTQRDFTFCPCPPKVNCDLHNFLPAFLRLTKF